MTCPTRQARQPKQHNGHVPDNWDEMSIDAVWALSNMNAIKGRAASSTVDALMFSLRVSVLDEPDTRRRIAQLSDEQAVEVGARLRSLKLRAWSADEVLIFIQIREKSK
jgi:hypothetical protein